MIGKIKEGCGIGTWYKDLNCILQLENAGEPHGYKYIVTHGTHKDKLIPISHVELLNDVFTPKVISSIKLTEVNNLIEEECDRIKRLLVIKNKNYNNSLHEPKRIFSKASRLEGILVRLDDKLNRIAKVGINDNTEDTIDDLIGYLIHLNVMLEIEKTKSKNE